MRGAILGFSAATILAALGACSREPAPDETAATVAEEADQDLNLDVWLERMEVGSRELYSAREAVISALGLEEGDVVADIGAGTGLYTLLFAERVGPRGRVYAEDIEPLFLDLINQRAEDAGFDNITPVLGRENDVTLPENEMDAVFIADTYHYFSNRESVMKSVLRSLKPGGSLFIVDYDLKPGGPRPEDKAHVRFGRAGVISEIEYVGFTFAEETTVEGLEENYFLRFVKADE
ncbi:class I SAM-dependent methyltransferase [Hyphococcus sp.]|uniref:class I SAM-dependent methyltransferase n=2 Tax=Hyphococcus sp. TaxID=2038636 RepID=UPI0035C6C39F